MATGCHTCGGTLTGPVGTTREASKVTMVFETVSVCGARVPVPLVTKAPEAPPTAQSVVLNWPVILRVSSLCHAPASSMLPPVQARKGAVRHKNSSRDTEIDDGRLSDICGSCFLCLTLVNIVSTVSYWCTNVCHIYYNTVCVVGIMKINVAL